MKTIFNLIFVAVCFTFFSCQKDENLSTGSSSITNDGLLKGKIVNYVPNSIDSLKVRYTDKIGAGKVSSAGEFSIGLSVPHLDMIGSKKGLEVSDTTAMTGSLLIYSFLNDNYNGMLDKCNYDSVSLTKAGFAYSMFIYSDRSFTIKGTYADTYSDGVNIQTTIYTDNVSFKKGWNEVVYKITSYTSTVNCTTTWSLTNIITSDLQWRFLKSNYSHIYEELPDKEKMRAFYPGVKTVRIENDTCLRHLAK